MVMVLSATNAQTLTSNAVTVQDAQDLATEVSLFESAVRNAASLGRYELSYNAQIIGNPAGDDPHVDASLTAIQISFRDALTAAGYVVDRDEDNEYWYASWATTGIQDIVAVYSVRTTVVPGPVETTTLTTINTYFGSLDPIVPVRSLLNVAEPGGDIDEADFGATVSAFYEYIVVANQPDDTDHSTALRTALIAITEYVDTPSNIFVYKVA